MTNTIYWIRHGQSVANTYKYLHSIILDPILTELGKEQMLEVSKILVENDIELIICSPLIRSIESGHILKKYIETHKRYSPKMVISFHMTEKGLGLDNISINGLGFLITKNNLAKRFFRNGSKHLFNDFNRELLDYSGKYKNIAIVGHDHTNADFIKRLSNQQITPMKNGEIIKMVLNNNNVESMENYLKKKPQD